MAGMAFTVTSYGQPTLPDAVPADAITGILKLFNSYQVVGLGEGPHGNLEGHAFRLKLLRDPRFTEVVDDILVESGTARCSDLTQP
jgi:erythromycin esterase-like protein